jgi:hypothetical protein
MSVMAKKPPPSESATLPAVQDSPILRRSTRAAACTVAPPAAVAAAADEAIGGSSAALFPASSSDTDDAAVALLAEPKPSSKGKKSAKGMDTEEAVLASAIASHVPVAAAAAVPIALISAEPPSWFDTDQAAAAHMATDDAPSKRNAVKAKKAPAPPRMQGQRQQWHRPPRLLILTSLLCSPRRLIQMSLLLHWLNVSRVSRGGQLKTPVKLVGVGEPFISLKGGTI